MLTIYQLCTTFDAFSPRLQKMNVFVTLLHLVLCEVVLAESDVEVAFWIHKILLAPGNVIRDHDKSCI